MSDQIEGESVSAERSATRYEEKAMWWLLTILLNGGIGFTLGVFDVWWYQLRFYLILIPSTIFCAWLRSKVRR